MYYIYVANSDYTLSSYVFIVIIEMLKKKMGEKVGYVKQRSWYRENSNIIPPPSLCQQISEYTVHILLQCL